MLRVVHDMARWREPRVASERRLDESTDNRGPGSGREGRNQSMARFEIADDWAAQAFQFTLDLAPDQAACVRRQFGGRRKARN